MAEMYPAEKRNLIVRSRYAHLCLLDVIELLLLENHPHAFAICIANNN